MDLLVLSKEKGLGLSARRMFTIVCQRQFKTDPLIGNIANLKLTHPWRLSVV
jgi:hypothetical protein